VYTLMPRVLWATGNTRFTMRVSFISAFAMVFAFYFGSFWGTAGIATAWIIAYPLTQSPVYWLAFRKIELSPLVYLRALWPAFSSSISMAIALWGIDNLLAENIGLTSELALKIILGAAIYGLTILLMHRETARNTLKIYRQLRSGTAPSLSAEQ
jgi:hypothetical protein